jgi:hypothetical protein
MLGIAVADRPGIADKLTAGGAGEDNAFRTSGMRARPSVTPASAAATSFGKFVANLLSYMAVKMVMPVIPPRALAEMLMVPAVPSRNDGTDKVKATTERRISVLAS